MKVTVIDREIQKLAWGKSNAGPSAFLRTIEIADTCPICAGPRGTPELRPFCEDGDFYAMHCWNNDCGHIDTYAAVLNESEVPKETT